MIARNVLLGLLLATGCAEESVEPVIEGDVHHYVVSEVHLPRTNQEARDIGLDLDGDDAVDNQFGMVVSTLQGMGFDLAGTVDESVVRGNALTLLELQALDFTNAPNVGLATYLGANPDPAACTDPQDLSTCGQHLTTRAHYDVVADSQSDVGHTVFDDSVLFADIPVLPIALGLDPSAPLRVDLRSARVKLLNMRPDGGTALISGGITARDRDEVVLPEAARQLDRIVATECHQPTGSGPCACTGRSGVLQEIFDANDDCSISLDELRANALVTSLVSTDIERDGVEMLSFGFAAELRPAAFETEPL